MAGPGDTTYTAIPNANLEPGQPARSIDALSLRDNPDAIAEGSSGAPRVMTGILNNRTVHTSSTTFVVPSEVYCVNVWIVGGGGAGGSNNPGTNGGNSSFDGIQANGGIAGGTTTDSNGANGGFMSCPNASIPYIERAGTGQSGDNGGTAGSAGNGFGGEPGYSATVDGRYPGLSGGKNAGVDTVSGVYGGGGQGRQVIGVYPGGGGGGFIQLRAYPVTPGASISIVVGAGGSGGTNSGNGGTGYVIVEY